MSGAAVFALAVAGAPSAAAEPAWTMPDLVGMSLEEAQIAYDEAIKNTGGPWLEVINGYHEGWTIRAPKMYDVCKQQPAAGKALEAKTWTAIAVNKRGDC
ncbi:PASTA domain-containing protein [Mycobacterium sp. NPDC003323]